jgi:hypothetical protein
MNANVVTASQRMRRSASTGFRPAGVSVFRGSSSIVHSHPGRPPARPPCKTGARQLPTIGLISLSFLNSPNLCISGCIPNLTPGSSVDRKSTAEATCQPLRPTLIRKETGQPFLPPDSLPSRDVTTRQTMAESKSVPARAVAETLWRFRRISCSGDGGNAPSDNKTNAWPAIFLNLRAF